MTKLATKTKALHKEAAKKSQSGETFFVVYIPDQGGDVYSKEQVVMYAPLINIEAAYLNGKEIAQ